jgi:hypothetical protein
VRTPGGGLELLSGALLAAYPPAAIAILATVRFFERRWSGFGTWLLLWGGFWLLAVVLFIVDGPEWPLLAQVAFATFLGGVLCVSRPRATVIGITWGLAMLAAVGLVERDLSRALWNDAATPQSFTNILQGITTIDADTPGWRRNGIRLIEKRWSLDSGTGHLEFSAQVRVTAPDAGWQWYTNAPETTQRLVIDDDGSTFTRLTNVERPVVRRVRLPEPVANRSFRATLETRSQGPPTTVSCGIRLRTFEPSHQTCAALTLDSEWRSITIETTFPGEVSHGVFEVALGPLHGAPLDVRGLRVEHLTDGTWADLRHSEPAGAHIRVPISGVHIFEHPVVTLPVGGDWHQIGVSITNEHVADHHTIGPLLHAESGSVVELRDVHLRTSTPGKAQPLPAAIGRVGAWFGHPNLLGHATAVLAAVALALALRTRTGWIGVLALALAAAVLLLAGSRAAWLGFAAAVMLAAPSFVERRRRRTVVTTSILIVTSVAVAGAIGLGRVGESIGADGNTVTRAEIWHTAIAAWRSAPGLGVHDTALEAAWHRERPGDSRSAPVHAHNFWLEYAQRYGTPGLVAALWLSLGLVFVAWRRRRWLGLSVVVPVLVMNVLDFTITTPGVLAPMVIGLNALRNLSSEPPAHHRSPPLSRQVRDEDFVSDSDTQALDSTS